MPRPRTTSREWIVDRAMLPGEKAIEGALVLREVELGAPAQGELLLRALWLSVDPTNRVWLTLRDSYMPAIRQGEVMRGFVLALVEESAADGFAAGDIVTGVLGWQERAVVPADAVQKVERITGIPLEAHVGLLSIHGLTSWLGITDRLRVRAGETVLISGAAGATGLVAGQLARSLGARVIGIAGGAAKCRTLTEELGYNAAVDYKSGDVTAELARRCPDGIDAFYDNVGGTILDAALENMKLFGRILIAGQIAGYDSAETLSDVPGPKRWGLILTSRLTFTSLIVLDHMDRAPEAFRELASLYRSGELTYRIESFDGIERAPEALDHLLRGGNIGKMAVRVSDLD